MSLLMVKVELKIADRQKEMQANVLNILMLKSNKLNYEPN